MRKADIKWTGDLNTMTQYDRWTIPRKFDHLRKIVLKNPSIRKGRELSIQFRFRGHVNDFPPVVKKWKCFIIMRPLISNELSNRSLE